MEDSSQRIYQQHEQAVREPDGHGRRVQQLLHDQQHLLHLSVPKLTRIIAWFAPSDEDRRQCIPEARRMIACTSSSVGEKLIWCSKFLHSSTYFGWYCLQLWMHRIGKDAFENAPHPLRTPPHRVTSRWVRTIFAMVTPTMPPHREGGTALPANINEAGLHRSSWRRHDDDTGRWADILHLLRQARTTRRRWGGRHLCPGHWPKYPKI